MTDLTKATLTGLGWEIMSHPPYNSDSLPSDFNLFGPMRVHLGGQKFHTDNELKPGVLN